MNNTTRSIATYVALLALVAGIVVAWVAGWNALASYHNTHTYTVIIDTKDADDIDDVVTDNVVDTVNQYVNHNLYGDWSQVTSISVADMNGKDIPLDHFYHHRVDIMPHK